MGIFLAKIKENLRIAILTDGILKLIKNKPLLQLKGGGIYAQHLFSQSRRKY